MEWPGGKKFAFTVFDDTDHISIDNGPPVYELLRDLGMRTTKSVWPLKGEGIPKVGGATCEDEAYLAWVLRLQEEGFEIALHNATYHTSERPFIFRAVERFEELFGHAPNIHVNHTGCDDALYWGDARLSGWRKPVYNLLTRGRNKAKYTGHVETSPLFWGDLCKEKVSYVRNFVFPEINTLKVCPFMPYYDDERRYANAWFASSEGANVDSFVSTIQEHAQDRLEEEGGLCIMYTHFGAGFVKDGALDSRFRILMERLAKKDGWFAPVSMVLDYLRERNGVHRISAGERAALERTWLWNKMLMGGTS